MANPARFLVQDQHHRYGDLLNPPLAPLSNPISVQNIIQAQNLKERALTERTKHLPSSATFVSNAAAAACVAYCDAVMAQHIGDAAAPPWFHQFSRDIDRRLNRLERRVIGRMDRLNRRTILTNRKIRKIDQKLDKLSSHVGNISAPLAREANRKMGENGPFLQVPFTGGIWPWDDEVPAQNNAHIRLPRLDNEAAVAALDGPLSSAYFCGYYPNQPIPHPISQRKEAIRNVIGRSNS